MLERIALIGSIAGLKKSFVDLDQTKKDKYSVHFDDFAARWHGQRTERVFVQAAPAIQNPSNGFIAIPRLGNPLCPGSDIRVSGSTSTGSK